jgi:hypothetical protein
MSRRRETARRRVARGEVVSRHDRARQIQVGGRIINVTERELQLADALAAVSVRLRRPEPGLRPGHLLVVTGRLLRGSLHQAQVVEHYPAPEPAAAGEFASTSFTGLGRQLRCRARAVAAIRHYFSRRGFMEVDTPVRVRCPGLDANVDAVRAEGGWLITSPELHMKRLLAGGLPRIFQLARCSRLEELGSWASRRRHTALRAGDRPSGVSAACGRGQRPRTRRTRRDPILQAAGGAGGASARSTHSARLSL